MLRYCALDAAQYLDAQCLDAQYMSTRTFTAGIVAYAVAFLFEDASSQ